MSLLFHFNLTTENYAYHCEKAFLQPYCLAANPTEKIIETNILDKLEVLNIKYLKEGPIR